ncbi:hypothetical protein CEUSTIGMA_g6410.t1 [Chlamydomonas eustigma]|uniref:C3H1-type domain-containing protein n=1 Tax=Chlamydomonas eustigma TaxID=1157962 RepID=A0A250X880_9CHLO|nr:hypothetical protein CEUSTIGMA_g6410.t1 [Chlamydomonas eustigma]|eukprot:GAX78970.1 hypothetical protein CEUSTIGMA_g6410.t1 [Chlamydomonas eustigma]
MFKRISSAYLRLSQPDHQDGKSDDEGDHEKMQEEMMDLFEQIFGSSLRRNGRQPQTGGMGEFLYHMMFHSGHMSQMHSSSSSHDYNHYTSDDEEQDMEDSYDPRLYKFSRETGDPSPAVLREREKMKKKDEERESYLRRTVHLQLLQQGPDSLLVGIEFVVEGDSPFRLVAGSLKLPEGVTMSIEYQKEGDRKWTSVENKVLSTSVTSKGHVLISKLKSGSTYCVRARLGIAGSLTWSGLPDWRAWGTTATFSTTNVTMRPSSSSAYETSTKSKGCRKPGSEQGSSQHRDCDALRKKVPEVEAGCEQTSTKCGEEPLTTDSEGRVEEEEEEEEEERQMRMGDGTESIRGGFHCRSCDIYCNSYQAYQTHMLSQRHVAHQYKGQHTSTLQPRDIHTSPCDGDSLGADPHPQQRNGLYAPSATRPVAEDLCSSPSPPASPPLEPSRKSTVSLECPARATKGRPYDAQLKQGHAIPSSTSHQPSHPSHLHSKVEAHNLNPVAAPPPPPPPRGQHRYQVPATSFPVPASPSSHADSSAVLHQQQHSVVEAALLSNSQEETRTRVATASLTSAAPLMAAATHPVPAAATPAATAAPPILKPVIFAPARNPQPPIINTNMAPAVPNECSAVSGVLYTHPHNTINTAFHLISTVQSAACAAASAFPLGHGQYLAAPPLPIMLPYQYPLAAAGAPLLHYPQAAAGGMAAVPSAAPPPPPPPPLPVQPSAHQGLKNPEEPPPFNEAPLPLQKTLHYQPSQHQYNSSASQHQYNSATQHLQQRSGLESATQLHMSRAGNKTSPDDVMVMKGPLAGPSVENLGKQPGIAPGMYNGHSQAAGWSGSKGKQQLKEDMMSMNRQQLQVMQIPSVSFQQLQTQPRTGIVDCRHFLRGFCSFGDKCNFKHDVAAQKSFLDNRGSQQRHSSTAKLSATEPCQDVSTTLLMDQDAVTPPCSQHGASSPPATGPASPPSPSATLTAKTADSAALFDAPPLQCNHQASPRGKEQHQQALHCADLLPMRRLVPRPVAVSRPPPLGTNAYVHHVLREEEERMLQKAITESLQHEHYFSAGSQVRVEDVAEFPRLGTMTKSK